MRLDEKQRVIDLARELTVALGNTRRILGNRRIPRRIERSRFVNRHPSRKRLRQGFA
jgi:hypothetical protein